ncbi:MAG: phosphotransferase family protein, partial [Gammaproteobacteria bacterium]|nr:phosphotransferase family protein [Gammaproteobacteria bacterium]
MSEQKDALDTVKLTTYLEQHISGFKGPVTAEKFTGGQSNPTYKLTAKSGTFILRRQPFGTLLKSAHAVDREFRVLNALKETTVPVGKVFYLCEDPEIIGSMFYIMEFCDGRIYWDPALPQIKDNDTRAAMYSNMNQVLTSIHSVDID